MQKLHTANTGFCAACDTYIQRALADQFGYKVAAAVLAAATVAGSTQAAVEREAVAARLEVLPVARRLQPMELSKPVERARLARLERDGARKRREVAGQRSAAYAEHAAKAEALVGALDVAEPPGMQVKYVSAGDRWVEGFDEESGRLFYYNVTDGHRQWHKPPVQQWNLMEKEYTPLQPPLVHPRTEQGLTLASAAEADRLAKATTRALGAVKVKDQRAAGLGPRSAAGQDIGPASAKVLPGSFRVRVGNFLSYLWGGGGGGKATPGPSSSDSLRSVQ